MSAPKKTWKFNELHLFAGLLAAFVSWGVFVDFRAIAIKSATYLEVAIIIVILSSLFAVDADNFGRPIRRVALLLSLSLLSVFAYIGVLEVIKYPEPVIESSMTDMHQEQPASTVCVPSSDVW